MMNRYEVIVTVLTGGGQSRPRKRYEWVRRVWPILGRVRMISSSRVVRLEEDQGTGLSLFVDWDYQN